MRIFQLFSILALSSVLVACGWHLRSDSQSGATLQSLYVGSELAAHERGPDSILQGFEQRMDDLDISPDNSISSAQLGLIVLSERRQEKVLSLTSDLFEQQTRLSKTVEYQIWRGEEILEPRGQVSTYRDMSQDQSNAAAKNRETDLIYKEINADLINQILRHLQRYGPTNDANQS